MRHEQTRKFLDESNTQTKKWPSEDTISSHEEASHSCRVIGFTGTKGGVGTTTVALNVAMTLVQKGHNVIYVELSPHLGTSAWLLKMPDSSSFGDSSARLEDINENFVNQLLMQHSTGLKVLCMSPWAQEVGYQVSTDLLTVLFRQLKNLADYLVLDFPLEPSFPSMFFLAQCEICNHVLEADAISIAKSKSQLELLQNHGCAQIFLTVVNRSGIPPADGIQGIQEQVGCEVLVVIPPVPELCCTAAVKKLPIVCIHPESVPALQFSRLSDLILIHFTENGSSSTSDRRFRRDRRKNDRRNKGNW
jgi:MinD-like ATPase involved in chromosome partitioning or flagellar assembly